MAGMMAALTIVTYGTLSVSAMMNATAPITGGMIWPPMLDVASTAPAKTGVYPKRFISGIVNWPTVSTLATPEPEIMPIMPDEITATLAGPPRAWPTNPSAMLLKRLIMPACSRKEPNRMNRKM